MRIGITGATGQVGRELASLLQKEGIPNQLLVREPDNALFLQHDSSRIVPFNFNCPDSFEEALNGLDRLFLVCASSASDNAMSDDAIRFFLHAAKMTGVREIVVMSGICADRIKTHFLAKLEALVKESQIPYVALRGNWFYQNFGSRFKEMITLHHELRFPDREASISFVDARDVAEVAFHFLSGGHYESGVGYDITGPESLTHKAVADLLSKHLPYHVGYRAISEQEAREQLGWSDELLDLFKDISKGLTAQVSNSVELILGKSARGMEAYIIENKLLWMNSEQR